MSTRIYVYSPSGAVQDRTALRRGIKYLQSMGCEVEVDESAQSRHMRFAGDDDARLAAIDRAAQSGADIALITRGGYGLSRIVHRLPFQAIHQSIENGMRWVGFSDFTALQMGLLAHQMQHTPSQVGQLPTWAGAAVCEDFGLDPQVREVDDIMQACFEDLCAQVGEGSGWRLPIADLKALSPQHLNANGELHLHDAVLWGGNLTLVASLVGTPYLPAIKNGILFLEDVHEHPYRIERMLTQLLHAGVLQQQQAIVLGAFTSIKPVPQDRGYKLATVVQWLRQQTNVPVLTGLPFGHVPTKVMLPVGQRLDLMVQGRDALLLWEDH